ncbi:hypothetical protein Mgra_00000421 [Meloidogyne graminicola]|uniref:Major facilitator superfamily (MFS) profile domain-containing protein n=1 Tax=Meloidogyne graminicola TaxID=189291 RepID=A0A8T0A2C3_9BILA|nr:hypothetical protein Mgra_00000421 [Meloidogyne graminicola]
MNSSNVMKPQVLYRTYSQRWVVLASVCLLALSNATQWIAFAPVHDAANLFYCNNLNNLSNNEIMKGVEGSSCDIETWSSQIFQLVGVITGLFGMFITDRYGIRVSNLLLMILSAFTMLFCLLVTRQKPPTPPSASSDFDKPEFFKGLCLLFNSKFFLIQTLTFGMAFALQWSIFFTASKQLLILGFDKTKLLHNPSVFSSIPVILIATLFIFFILMGIFAIPVFPISLELGVESTFPIAEASSSGILVIAGYNRLEYEQNARILINKCNEIN